MSSFRRHIAKAKIFFRKLNSFLTQDMWLVDLESLGKFKKRLLLDIQVASYMLKTFKEERIGLQSASLSYFCFMAAVPFLACAFAITGGLGLDDKLTALMAEQFSEYPFIVENVLSAAGRIIDTAKSGMFGLFSALFFVWLIIWMMMCVERVFNSAWKVSADNNRNFFKRLGFCLSILILAPFLILIFATSTVIYSNVLDFLIPSFTFSEDIKSLLGWVIFGAISVGVITAMYKFIPYTRVKIRCAFKAALLAGIAFTLLQYLYIETQLMVTRVNYVYGTVAALPLFMLWMRFGWLIIMYGCELAYAYQNLDDYKDIVIETWDDKRRKGFSIFKLIVDDDDNKDEIEPEKTE